MDNMIEDIRRDISTFIRSCPLGDFWPNETILLANNQVYRNNPGEHAEKVFLGRLGETLANEGDQTFTLYINYSPCKDCADKILDFLNKHDKVKFTIIFAHVYNGHEECNRNGLAALHGHERITLRAIQGKDWEIIIKQILSYHGRKNRLREILNKFGDYGLETVLQHILQVFGWEGGWENVLSQILQHLGQHLGHDGWEDALARIRQPPEHNRWGAVSQNILQQHDDREDVLNGALKRYGLAQWSDHLMQIVRKHEHNDWGTQSGQFLQRQGQNQLHNKAMQVLYHHGKDSLKTILEGISLENGEGYAWLLQVLRALNIMANNEEVNEEWLGRRIVADFVAQKELDYILQEAEEAQEAAAN